VNHAAQIHKWGYAARLAAEALRDRMLTFAWVGRDARRIEHDRRRSLHESCKFCD
jgi:hypothetical protein